MSGIWPVELPPISSARVYDYLARGKDHFLADREMAEQMLAAHPEHLALVEENARFVDQKVEDLAVEGTDQYLVLGCGFPRRTETPVHVVAQTFTPTATTIYLDRDLACVVTTRAHYDANPNVSVFDGDFTNPHRLLADPGLHSALAPDRPVAVVCDLTLQHLADHDITALSAALATALPAGSRLVLTHPAEDAALAADVYTTAIVQDLATEDAYRTRGVEHLAPLLKGWTLVTAEVSEHGLLTATTRLP